MDVAAPSTSAGSRPSRPRLTLTTTILLAIWLGLCAGYLDVGFILVKKLFLNKEGAYRSARDFPWTVPVAHVALALVPAAVLVVANGRRPGRLSLRVGSWLLATFAVWAALLRLPLHIASSLILAAGVGKLFGDAVAAFDFGPHVGWVRKSLTGLLGLLVILIAATTGRQALRESRAVAGLPASPSARNVLFIVWDTVRASNLSLYRYPRATTPNLARWAEKGVRYNRAIAPAPWTIPSHASFFTGQWPFQTNSQWKFALDTPDPTLAEFLAARGYQTAGFAANTNCCTYETGLDRGFIHFEDYTLTPQSLLSRTVPGKWIGDQILGVLAPYDRKWFNLESRGAGAVNDAFLGWVGRRRSDRPFFAFLNYFDAHEPYIPPAGREGRFGIKPTSIRDYQFLVDYIGMDKGQLNRRDFSMVLDCYDDCIAFLDDRLGRLLDELERRRLLEDTVVIITSDHGEGIGEHNIFGHSYSVDIEAVGVPLVILAPGAPAGRSVLTSVSLRDLPATVTDLLGLAEESPFPGRSLAEYWRASPEQAPARLASPALSEQADETAFQPQPGEDQGRRGFQMSLVSPDDFQYIRNGQGGEHLFNLLRDPRERFNLIGSPEGDALVGRFRRSLLEALTENKGSVEVEDAYLTVYRRRLADLVRGGDAREVAAPVPKTPSDDRAAR